MLDTLLQSEASLVCCPAWGIAALRIPSNWLPALEANRMLIVEMRDHSGNLAAAEARNRFVLASTENKSIPYTTPGGMLARLLAMKTMVSP